jgi:phage-related holin
MFGVILDAAHVLVGLAVISTTSDVTADIARRKTATEIARRVLIDLMISIAMTITVVVTTTSTTFLSALVIAATTAIATTAIATTTWGIGWGQIVAMLVTWML